MRDHIVVGLLRGFAYKCCWDSFVRRIAVESSWLSRGHLWLVMTVLGGTRCRVGRVVSLGSVKVTVNFQRYCTVYWYCPVLSLPPCHLSYHVSFSPLLLFQPPLSSYPYPQSMAALPHHLTLFYQLIPYNPPCSTQLIS